MGWKRVEIVIKLASPIHVGFLPSEYSVISHTRYYVPGKNIWGAITKNLTEHFNRKPVGNDYKFIGEQISDAIKFSYFYVFDGCKIYYPNYTNAGLIYGDNEMFNAYSFEERFIGSRVLTAIDSKTGTAKQESLHEIEFIKDKYFDDNADIQATKLCGCIWVKENATIEIKEGKSLEIKVQHGGIFIEKYNLIDGLTLGGEAKYGFGKTMLEQTIETSRKLPISTMHDSDDVVIVFKDNNRLLAHMKYDADVDFKGDIEVVVGREYDKKENSAQFVNPGKMISVGSISYIPGSHIEEEGDKIVIGDYGMWVKER